MPVCRGWRLLAGAVVEGVFCGFAGASVRGALCGDWSACVVLGFELSAFSSVTAGGGIGLLMALFRVELALKLLGGVFLGVFGLGQVFFCIFWGRLTKWLWMFETSKPGPFGFRVCPCAY